MYLISAMQSKVARTYLEWSQGDLASAAHVSLSTVSSFENGFVPRQSSLLQIRKALENAGIEFTEGEGVKRRDDEARLYRGANSSDVFYNDLLQTSRNQSSDVYCIVKSQHMLMQACGLAGCDDLMPFEVLGETTTVKCLVTESHASLFQLPSFEFRAIPPYYTSPAFYFGYGNKYAHIVEEGRDGFIYAVFRSVVTAQNYRSHFLSLWNSAHTLRENVPMERRSSKNMARA